MRYIVLPPGCEARHIVVESTTGRRPGTEGEREGGKREGEGKVAKEGGQVRMLLLKRWKENRQLNREPEKCQPGAELSS